MRILKKINESDLTKTLSKNFGHQSFRPGQEAVIRDVLAGGERLVVLPTGGGKSLCYLLPALLVEGQTLVVSPLIALMEDQKERALAAGLKAVVWNRETRDQDLAAARIIFVSPEKLALIDKARLNELAVWHLVIDEAHCVEDWGGSFRPWYNHLAELKKTLDPAAVSVFTASARPAQQKSLIKRLGLIKPSEFTASFDRPNIAWHFYQSSFPLLAAIKLLQSSEGRAIVYCRTRLGAARAARAFQAFGLKARPFHAGIKREKRLELQNEFLSGKVEILAATSAFGMGIDAPSVRTVIHLGAPTGCNAYYQESGRAGRDGEPALAVCFSHPREKRWLKDQKEFAKLLKTLLKDPPEAWTEAELDKILSELESDYDPAAVVAFLAHYQVCRLEAPDLIKPVPGAARVLRQALKDYTASLADEEAWLTRFLDPTSGCRRSLLIGSFEKFAVKDCGGCGHCGSSYSALLDEVNFETESETQAFKRFFKTPWAERPDWVQNERLSVLEEAWKDLF